MFLRSAVVLCAVAALASAASPLADQAQAAWAKRDQPGQTALAIRLWRDALSVDPAQPLLWNPLTKALNRAVRHTDTPAERKRLAQDARDAGAEAVRLNPDVPEAWAYYGEAIGQHAQAHKSIASLKAVKNAVAACHKAIALKPDYAYAHMLLAEFYRQSPGVISIGDKKKALEHAQKAVAYGPEYAINRLVLARALLEFNRKEEAIIQLKAAVALDPPPDAVPETRSDQFTAKTLLMEIENRA